MNDPEVTSTRAHEWQIVQHEMKRITLQREDFRKKTEIGQIKKASLSKQKIQVKRKSKKKILKQNTKHKISRGPGGD